MKYQVMDEYKSLNNFSGRVSKKPDLAIAGYWQRLLLGGKVGLGIQWTSFTRLAITGICSKGQYLAMILMKRDTNQQHGNHMHKSPWISRRCKRLEDISFVVSCVMKEED